MGENNARGVIGHNLKYFLFCLVPIELCCMSYCKLMPIETFFLRAAGRRPLVKKFTPLGLTVLMA